MSINCNKSETIRMKSGLKLEIESFVHIELLHDPKRKEIVMKVESKELLVLGTENLIIRVI